MSVGLIAKKLGMTQVYDPQGNLREVTVLEVGPCTVLQVKTKEGKDKYNAVQLGFGDQKQQRMPKAELGHLAKANVVKDGVAHCGRVIREFRNFSKEVKVGDVVGPMLFEVGQYVDVIGTSKGKGFQGVIFRHHMQGGPESHGHKGWHRRVGAIGMRSFPGTVRRNQRMPGHMGDERITTQNLEVVQVREKENLLLIQGSVPGTRGGYVIVRTSVKLGTEKRKLPAPPATDKKGAAKAGPKAVAPAKAGAKK
ncbi:MAG: 50S ribosomal protein L3 [Verrucomicrobia bacterium GWF2_62_7]|nr:MAG: 50S ribosomal protein L3 [Verrucomicrobia bacterium GWF2_62_7]